MTASSVSVQQTARLAIAISIMALSGLVFIALFFSLGGPFGTLNDASVGFEGVLSGGLAWMLYPAHRSYAQSLSRFALITALLGACIVALGSTMVIFGITGWFLAGLVTTLGYSLIGVWLMGLNYSARHRAAFPRRLTELGMIAGAITAVGLLAAVGILTRTDDPRAAPWFVSISIYASGLGWNILYAIWSLWLGRLLLSNRLDLQDATTTGPLIS